MALKSIATKLQKRRDEDEELHHGDRRAYKIGWVDEQGGTNKVDFQGGEIWNSHSLASATVPTEAEDNKPTAQRANTIKKPIHRMS